MSKDQFKAKAKKLVSLLADVAGPVQYQDALDVLAQLEGYRNWKTLSAVLEDAPAGSPTGRTSVSQPNLQGIPLRTPEGAAVRSAFCDFFNIEGTRTGRTSSAKAAESAKPRSSRQTFHVPGEGPYQQDEVPGVGFLFSVPISVDTSMTARVLVRARNQDDAIDEARRLVSEGKATMEVDEGNYRGPSDYYCSDDSEDGVYCSAEPTNPTVCTVDDGGQVGPYLVEVYKDDEDPTQVWADLVVFDSNDEGPVGGDPVSVLTPMSPDASLSEYVEYCMRVARALYAQFPDPAKADQKAIEHQFRLLSQTV